MGCPVASFREGPGGEYLQCERLRLEPFDPMGFAHGDCDFFFAKSVGKDHFGVGFGKGEEVFGCDFLHGSELGFGWHNPLE